MGAESGYKLICEKSIRVKDASGAKQSDEDAAKERFSTLGEQLKLIFQKGPSPVINSKGKVILIDEDIEDDSDNNNDNKPAEDADNNPTNDSFKLRKKTYSIFEAYRKLNPQNKFYEDGAPAPSLPFAGMDFPGMGDLLNPGNNDNGQEDPPDEESDAKDDDAEKEKEKEAERQRMKENDTFVLGGSIGVRVWLENEGYTDWLLLVHESALPALNEIESNLRNKQFKKAYDIATKGLKTDGLVPVAFRTYVYEKAAAHCPYIGFSNWALGYGNVVIDSDGSSSMANKDNSPYLSLAVAPYDRKKGDNTNNVVFIAQYRILDLKDFVGGKFSNIFGKALSVIKALADGDVSKLSQSDEAKDGKALEVGDKSDWKRFFDVRDTIDKAIKSSSASSNLEYQQDLSTQVSEGSNNLVASVKDKGLFVTY